MESGQKKLSPKIEKIISPEAKEKEGARTIVELGGGYRSLLSRIGDRNKKEIIYKAGQKSEEIFQLNAGDLFLEVDLPWNESIDVARHWRGKPGEESHLEGIRDEFKKYLPEGVHGEVVHADGQKLPFADASVDVLYMANVLSGNVKGDEITREANGREILREKTNLLKEVKRVLKVKGKLIIEEEFAPASRVQFAWDKVMDDLEQDPEFSIRTLENFEGAGEKLILECEKNNREKSGPGL